MHGFLPRLGSFVLFGALVLPVAAQEMKLPVTAVFTITDPSYVRKRQADGSFKTETYAFGEGEFHSGGMRDQSIDALPFRQIANTLAEPLAARGYVCGTTPKETELLIVVHWGTTIPFNDGTYKSGLQALSYAMAPQFRAAVPPPTGPQNNPGETAALNASLDNAQSGEIDSLLMMQDQFNQMREKANWHNALMLGYAPEMNRLASVASIGGFAHLRQDLVDDIEDERYFVVLVAFDFQKLWKEKKKQVLWITRLSIRTRGHAFDRDLAAMAKAASPYFGESTKTLIRTRRNGHVEVGTPEFVRFEEKK